MGKTAICWYCIDSKTSADLPAVVKTTSKIFSTAYWANVLFTDETRFNLRRSDGRLRVNLEEAKGTVHHVLKKRGILDEVL